MAKQDRSTVVGVFENRDQAECAISGLKELGLREDQIGIAARDSANAPAGKTVTHTRTGEDAVGGAVTGGLLGGLLGAAGALLIPGVGPIVAGGILAATLGGAAVGAAAGGLLGALVGLGVPEEEARYYDQEFKAGRILVTAKAEGRYTEANAVLRRCGAMEVKSGATGGMTGGASGIEDTGTVRLREEKLEAHKQPVQTGEVSIHKQVVTETKTVQVPVTREEVVIERRPVRDGETVRGEIGEGQEIRVPVMEEKVVVEKKPVVKEEISIHKQAIQDTKEVSAEVRREEAHLHREGQIDVKGDRLDEHSKK